MRKSERQAAPFTSLYISKFQPQPLGNNETCVNRFAKLPGTNKNAGDMGADGASIIKHDNGITQVTIWIGHARSLFRYTWKVDQQGRYIPRTGCFSSGASRYFRGVFSDSRS